MSDIDSAMEEFRSLDEKRQLEELPPEDEQRWDQLRQWLIAVEQQQPEALAPQEFTQPQGYYAEDGNWYPYPAEAQDVDAQAAGYDANAAAAYDPNVQSYDPNVQGYDPNAQSYDPNSTAYDPNAAAYPAIDPAAGGYNADGGIYDPGTGLYVSNDGYDVAASPETTGAEYENPVAASPPASVQDGNEVPSADEADVLEVDDGLVTLVDEQQTADGVEPAKAWLPESEAPQASSFGEPLAAIEEPPPVDGIMPERIAGAHPLLEEAVPVLEATAYEMTPEQLVLDAVPETLQVEPGDPFGPPSFDATAPDLAGSPDDVVPLAATNDFVSYQPSEAPEQTIELGAEDAAPLVESGPLAGISQDVGAYAPADAPLQTSEASALTLDDEPMQELGIAARGWPDAHTDPGIPFEASTQTVEAGWNEAPTLEAEPLPPDWKPPTEGVRDESQAIALPPEELAPTPVPVPQAPGPRLSIPQPPQPSAVSLPAPVQWPVAAQPMPLITRVAPAPIPLRNVPLGSPPPPSEDGAIDVDMGPTGSFAIPPAPAFVAPAAPVFVEPEPEREPEPELELELIEEVGVLPAPLPAAPVATQTAATLFTKPSVGGSAGFLNQSFVGGEHRVIVHTVEGQVKRGTVRDLDLIDDVIRLEQQTGNPERIPAKRVKAIFFMLPPGSRQPAATGEKIRVTFMDGRQVAGFSQDFRNAEDPGFFVVPADNRTNTARIYIFRTSVQAVAVG